MVWLRLSMAQKTGAKASFIHWHRSSLDVCLVTGVSVRCRLMCGGMHGVDGQCKGMGKDLGMSFDGVGVSWSKGC